MLYFIGIENGSWDNIENWFDDAEGTMPIGRIPTPGEDVTILNQLDSGPSTVVNLTSVNIGRQGFGNEFTVLLSNVRADTLDIWETLNAITAGGEIFQAITFHEDSTCGATLASATPILFTDAAALVRDVELATAIFDTNATNYGNISDAVFKGVAINKGTVETARFEGEAYNASNEGGSVTIQATFTVASAIGQLLAGSYPGSLQGVIIETETPPSDGFGTRPPAFVL